MTIYDAVIATITVFVLACAIWRNFILKRMRARGLFPEKGKETLGDVRKLAISGEIYLAIYCYRLLYKSSLKDAVKAVNELDFDNTD